MPTFLYLYPSPVGMGSWIHFITRSDSSHIASGVSFAEAVATVDAYLQVFFPSNRLTDTY